MRMQLNEAVSKRLTELLSERNMTQYQLFMKSGVPKSTIGNVINCSYESVKLRIIHEMCQGLGITLCDFFQSPLFDDYHLDPKTPIQPFGMYRSFFVGEMYCRRYGFFVFNEHSHFTFSNFPN